jgi:protease II
MQGDKNPFRQIGDFKMYDNLAILEDPTSKEFKQTVKSEINRWQSSLKPFEKQVKRWETLFENMYKEAIPDGPEYANESVGNIKIQYSSGHRLNVWFDRKKQKHFSGLSGFGKDSESDLYYTIEDVGNGSETLQLTVYDKTQMLWQTKPVGPEAVFYNDRLIFQSVENQLRYPGILSAEKRTGKNIQHLFEEPDKRYQIELIQPPYQPYVFLRKQNALNQTLAILENGKFSTFTKEKDQWLFPLTKGIYATNTHIKIKDESFPLLPNEFFVDGIITNTQILYTTIHLAKMTLYMFDLQKKSIERIFYKDYPCDIKLRKLADQITIEIGFPHKSSKIYTYEEQSKKLKHVFTFPEPMTLELKHGLAESKDGTRVPYTVVWPKQTNEKPHNLFIEGYGSYGISSRRTYPIQRLAWLKKGFAVAVSYARGGREDGDRWYDGGRTALRKQNTFDDTAAVINHIQNIYGFSPKRTIFYGRSAGGLLAANIAHQYPNLTGAVYAEVPYLDVLRTTSNPSLPLTQMEYDEFGDPIKRPDELKAIQKFSPVDTVPQATKQSPFILVKTALNDSQVLPYETLKWAKKLREKNWTVLVGIDGGGHFVEEAKLYRGLAEDAVLLNHALKKSTGTRRAKSSAKHFTRHRTSSLAE